MALNNRALKKILIFVDWYEPGFKGGGPIRSVANLVHNLDSCYAFFIFTSDRDLGDPSPYKEVETDKWVTLNNTHIFYASPSALNWRSISKLVKSVSPDFIYLNGMYALYYSIYPLLTKKLNITSAKVILAPRGMLQKGALQFKPFRKKLFLKIIAALSIPKLITGHATDEQEKNDIYKYLPGIRNVLVLSNFSSDVAASPLPIRKQKNEISAVFISRISPKKNLYAFISQLNTLSPSVNFRFTVFGGIEDDAYWNECEQSIARLPQNIIVTYKGPVSNNEVPAILKDHHIFVLPTLGENFGHAIFEALSVGRPVLISDQTPWRNLESRRAGWDLPLDNPSAFIDTLEQIAEMDNEDFQSWCNGAWQLANEYVIKNDLKNQYLKLFS